jgi:ATP-binding cassette subfamily F protein uup
MLEKELPLLEEEKRSITEKMSSGDISYEELQSLSEKMIALTRQLEEKEMRWLELSEME